MKIKIFEYIKRCISQRNLVVVLLLGWACSVLGQAIPKKMLTPKDYHKWHEIFDIQLSPDGKWASFNKFYLNQPDTLVIKSTTSDKKYTYEDATFVNCNSKASYYAFLNLKKGVGYVNLASGSTNWVANGIIYKFSDDGKFLGIKTNNPERTQFKTDIYIIDLEAKTQLYIKGGTDFQFSPNSLWTAVVQENLQGNYSKLIENDTGNETIANQSISGRFSMPTWQPNNKSIAFLSSSVVTENKTVVNELFYYQWQNKKLEQLDFKREDNMKDIGVSSLLKPFFSDDGETIFFYYQNPPPIVSQSTDTIANVEIWNTSDRWLPPRKAGDWDEEAGPWLAKWDLGSGNYSLIGSYELPSVTLTGNQENALLYNKLQYEPQHKQFPEADLFIKNLKTGSLDLLKSRQSLAYGTSIISPDGRFIMYYTDSEWWLYDITKKAHTNLTIDIPFSISQNDKEYPRKPQAFEIPKWVGGCDYVIISDKYDLWKVKYDGKEVHRLTNGRKDSIIYRLDKPAQTGASPKFQLNIFDLNSNLLLQMRKKNYSTGYALLKPNGSIESLAFHNSRISNLNKALDNDSYLYQEESFTSAPKLIFSNGKSSEEKVLYQTNKQAENYKQGKSELISYQNKDGKQLNGILYYPDNYSKDKKYPMVLHIYEKLSQDFFEYKYPSEMANNGFNIRNFTRSGYFVLEPDITYTIGDPGISATDCVLAAVAKVVEMGIVKKDKIGLLGHSFGGYETSFIVSQSNVFAAAVSGAGSSDALSHYLTMGWNNGQPDIWRYEDQQWRMGKSFFEAPDAYRRNSVIEHTPNINTPLLLWSGAQDVQVNWNQNIELFLALRRLNKTATFLIYQDEAHAIDTIKNAIDLNQKILDWFDHYLK